MFFDWLSIYQDFSGVLPVIGDILEIIVDSETGETLTERQPSHKHEGSFSTSISIRISGNRITVKGNPSRLDRLDNLFGFSSIDDCVSKYNQVLLKLGLPPFTKCTKTFQHTGEDGKKVFVTSNGAVITELHITSNKSVGEGNVSKYLEGLSSLRYRNSRPRLHANGCTVDWLSKAGHAPLVYASVYEKSNELRLHSLNKIGRKFGTQSDEYIQLTKIINYCELQGIARFEQKLKSRFLRRENLQFWGLADYLILNQLHQEFLDIDTRLEVEKMELEHISETLLNKKICKSTLSANSTAGYAHLWMHGKRFDLSKRNIQTHRARLRKIGIDIADPCDLSRFSPVRVISSRLIEVHELEVPTWYQLPRIQHLRVA